MNHFAERTLSGIDTNNINHLVLPSSVAAIIVGGDNGSSGQVLCKSSTNKLHWDFVDDIEIPDHSISGNKLKLDITFTTSGNITLYKDPAGGGQLATLTAQDLVATNEFIVQGTSRKVEIDATSGNIIQYESYTDENTNDEYASIKNGIIFCRGINLGGNESGENILTFTNGGSIAGVGNITSTGVITTTNQLKSTRAETEGGVVVYGLDITGNALIGGLLNVGSVNSSGTHSTTGNQTINGNLTLVRLNTQGDGIAGNFKIQTKTLNSFVDTFELDSSGDIKLVRDITSTNGIISTTKQLKSTRATTEGGAVVYGLDISGNSLFGGDVVINENVANGGSKIRTNNRLDIIGDVDIIPTASSDNTYPVIEISTLTDNANTIQPEIKFYYDLEIYHTDSSDGSTSIKFLVDTHETASITTIHDNLEVVDGTSKMFKVDGVNRLVEGYGTNTDNLQNPTWTINGKDGTDEKSIATIDRLIVNGNNSFDGLGLYDKKNDIRGYTDFRINETLQSIDFINVSNEVKTMIAPQRVGVGTNTSGFLLQEGSLYLPDTNSDSNNIKGVLAFGIPHTSTLSNAPLYIGKLSNTDTTGGIVFQSQNPCIIGNTPTGGETHKTRCFNLDLSDSSNIFTNPNHAEDICITRFYPTNNEYKFPQDVLGFSTWNDETNDTYDYTFLNINFYVLIPPSINSLSTYTKFLICWQVYVHEAIWGEPSGNQGYRDLFYRYRYRTTANTTLRSIGKDNTYWRSGQGNKSTTGSQTDENALFGGGYNAYFEDVLEMPNDVGATDNIEIFVQLRNSPIGASESAFIELRGGISNIAGSVSYPDWIISTKPLNTSLLRVVNSFT